MNRRRAASAVVCSVLSVAAVTGARFGFLAHPERQFTSYPFALSRRAVIAGLTMSDSGRTRPASATGVEHLCRDGSRVGPPGAIRTGVLRKATLLRMDDGVRCQRRTLSLMVTEVFLVIRVDLSLSGLSRVMKLPPGRRCLRAPLAVRPDARSAPVLRREAGRPAAHLRRCSAEQRCHTEHNDNRDTCHVAKLKSRNGPRVEGGPLLRTNPSVP